MNVNKIVRVGLLCTLTTSYTAMFAQRFVDVVPDEAGQIGALNRAIDGDTTATGERIEPENTIYRLERGATYRLNLAIRNAGFPLVIEAAKGEGAMPRIIPGVTLEGSTDVPFRPLNDFTLKGVFLSGKDSNDGLIDQLIRIQAEDVRITVDSCFFDESSQSAFRTDTQGVSIFLTNSVIARMGTPDDIDNGRVVDDRGNNIDTLLLENNTIYNISSRVVRNGGTNSIIKYCEFNQNTIANVGQRMADFGPIISFVFTNNIIINPAFLGVTVDRDPFNPNEPDPNAEPATATIVLDSVAQSILDTEGVSQTAIIRNNNVHYTDSLINARPESDPAPDDDGLLVSRPTFSSTATRFIEDGGFEASNIMDTLEFQNAAPDPTVFVEEFWNNVDGTNILSPWNNEGVPYSYSYPGDSPSATASISGEQLGDLGWPLIIFSKEALEDLIATAEQLIAANQVGNNIGNFAQFAVDSLQRAIDASQIVVDDPAATAEEIENAINTLNDAIDFFFSRLITGTSPKSGKSILVYPNPSSSFFRIQSESELKAVNLITLEGKEIHTWHSPLPDQDYGITRLSTGVYLIQLKLKDGTLQTIRMVKK